MRKREQDPVTIAVVGFIAAALVFSVIVTYWEVVVFWLFIGILAATIVVALAFLLKGQSRW